MTSSLFVQMLSSIILILGLLGIALNRNNLINSLLSITLIFIAAAMNFANFSYFLGDLAGQIFIVFETIDLICEVVIGLSIVMLFYRVKKSIRVDDCSELKG